MPYLNRRIFSRLRLRTRLRYLRRRRLIRRLRLRLRLRLHLRRPRRPRGFLQTILQPLRYRTLIRLPILKRL